MHIWSPDPQLDKARQGDLQRHSLSLINILELIFTDKSQTQVEAIFSEGTGTPLDMESTADHITSGVSWSIGISPYPPIPPIGQAPVTTLSLDLFNIYSNEI